MAETFPKEIVVEGVGLRQLTETTWENVTETDAGLDFHITDEGLPGEFPDGSFTVDLFRASVADLDAAYVDTFGAETLEEAVRAAADWKL